MLKKKGRNGHVETARYSVLDACAYSGMSGFGLHWITPYFLVLGASSAFIGILNAASTLASGIAQFVGGFVTQFVRDRKGLIVRFAALQAVLWLPLALLPLFVVDLPALLLIYTALITAGAFVGPAWTALMGAAIDESERARYFGVRDRIAGILEFASVAIAGLLLKTFDVPLYGYVVLFTMAFAFRALSTYYLTRHSDFTSKFAEVKRKRVAIIAFRDSNFAYYAFLTVGIGATTAIASPYFAVYMLKYLAFDYTTFGIATAISVVASFYTMPYWGKLADRYGSAVILFACGALIPLIPLLWLFSESPFWIFLVQAYSGFIWAGFGLATFDFLLTIAPKGAVHSYAGNYGALSSAIHFFGFLAGSALVGTIGEAQFGFLQGLQIIFVISALARFGIFATFVLSGGMEKFRATEKIKISEKRFLWKVVAVYPIKGIAGEVAHISAMFGRVVKKHIKRDSRFGRQLRQSFEKAI